MKKLFAVFFVISIILMYFISPYLALYQIEQSVREKNLNKTMYFVDIDRTRENLKERMVKETVLKNTNPNASAIVNQAKALVITKSVNYVVDLTFTPENIKIFLNQMILNKREKTNDVGVAYYYEDMNTFNIMYIINKNEHIIKLSREKLFFWKITDIVFPLDATLFGQQIESINQ